MGWKKSRNDFKPIPSGSGNPFSPERIYKHVYNQHSNQQFHGNPRNINHIYEVGYFNRGEPGIPNRSNFESVHSNQFYNMNNIPQVPSPGHFGQGGANQQNQQNGPNNQGNIRPGPPGNNQGPQGHGYSGKIKSHRQIIVRL